MDSLEQVILYSCPPAYLPSNPLEISTRESSPTLGSSRDGWPFQSPTKLESGPVDSEQNHYHTPLPDDAAQNDLATREWRLFLRRHRRLLYMLATMLFVILAASAIAGGVIWELTVGKSLVL